MKPAITLVKKQEKPAQSNANTDSYGSLNSSDGSGKSFRYERFPDESIYRHECVLGAQRSRDSVIRINRRTFCKSPEPHEAVSHFDTVIAQLFEDR